MSNQILSFLKSPDDTWTKCCGLSGLTVPAVGVVQAVQFFAGTDSFSIGQSKSFAIEPTQTSTFTLYVQGIASVEFSLFDPATGIFLIPTSTTTTYTPYVLTLEQYTKYFFRVRALAAIAAGTFYMTWAASRTPTLASVLPLSTFVGPSDLGAGESFVQNATGAVITLNRTFNATVAPDDILFRAGPMLTSGSYTITSSNTAIIPNSTGIYSVGQTLGPQIYNIVTGAFSGTLTVVFSGIGATVPVDLVLASSG